MREGVTMELECAGAGRFTAGNDEGLIYARARELGYESSSCDGCGAAGRSERRVAAGSTSGVASDHACLACGGSGRWWFPERRAMRSSIAPVTDAQLLVLPRSDARTAVLHGQ